MPLPLPVGRQKDVLALPPEGHIVVLGTAGSGKTTLAILRAAFLADPRTAHSGPTLLVTFNRALVTYLRHLQEKQLRQVTIEHYHLFARGYLNNRGKMSPDGICGPTMRETLIAAAVRTLQKKKGISRVLTLSTETLAGEIQWMSRHGINSQSDYEAAKRASSGDPQIPPRESATLHELQTEYVAARKAAGKDYDWDDIATAVYEEFGSDNSPRRYKHVVIDEGQDFSPQMIKSLVRAIPADGSLTFFGDVAQQIYGLRVSWRSAGLKNKKVWLFEENYRNSKQIATLAVALSKTPHFAGTPDLVVPKAPAADGPLPTIVQCSSGQKELEFVALSAKAASRAQRVAILVGNRASEGPIAKLLPKSATRLHADMNAWEITPGIWYGTYHSAKGLEFDMVYLPFLSEGEMPPQNDVKTMGASDASRQHARLLYVGITRAKRALVISHVGKRSSLLPSGTGLYTETKQ